LKITGLEQKAEHGVPPQLPLLGCVQVLPLHTSLVQLLPSSAHVVPEGAGVFEQVPETQLSWVHGFESLQVLLVVHA
jgi:hypothetical protein